MPHMSEDEFRLRFPEQARELTRSIRRQREVQEEKPTMANPLIIDLPLPPRALSPNARCHWAAKARNAKFARDLANLTASEHRPAKPYGAVAYRLIAWTANPTDDDNIIAQCKAYRDGIADAGIVTNDANMRCFGVENHVDGKRSGKRGIRFVIWHETE